MSREGAQGAQGRALEIDRRPAILVGEGHTEISSRPVGIFTVHLVNGFNFMNITGMTDGGPQFGMPGYETTLLYIGGLLALLLTGLSHLSVDQKLARTEGTYPPSTF